MQGLERLSIKALSQRLEKRRLQQEMDFHKLFLMTRHYQDVQQGGPQCTFQWSFQTKTRLGCGQNNHSNNELSCFPGLSIPADYVESLNEEATQLGLEVFWMCCIWRKAHFDEWQSRRQALRSPFALNEQMHRAFNLK